MTPSSIYLNKKQHIEKKLGNLPHWFQEGKLQFITFRLGDAIPRYVANQIKADKERFVANHPHPWDEKTSKEFWILFGNVEDKILHQGHGLCVLREPSTRQILIDSLKFVEDKRCHIFSYVIMPNHCHVLLLPIDDEKPDEILGSVKNYSSRLINKHLGRVGNLWQRECFDTVIRNRESFSAKLDYIQANPQNLRPDEYELYVNYQLLYGI